MYEPQNVGFDPALYSTFNALIKCNFQVTDKEVYETFFQISNDTDTMLQEVKDFITKFEFQTSGTWYHHATTHRDIQLKVAESQNPDGKIDIISFMKIWIVYFAICREFQRREM